MRRAVLLSLCVLTVLVLYVNSKLYFSNLSLASFYSKSQQRELPLGDNFLPSMLPLPPAIMTPTVEELEMIQELARYHTKRPLPLSPFQWKWNPPSVAELSASPEDVKLSEPKSPYVEDVPITPPISVPPTLSATPSSTKMVTSSSTPAFPASLDPQLAKSFDEVLEEYKVDKNEPVAITLVRYLTLKKLSSFRVTLISVRRFNFTRYIIIAGDKPTYEALSAADEPVMLLPLSHDESFLKYGTLAYQKLMHYRLLYIKYMLMSNYSVLLFDVDQVWSADPFAFINDKENADLHAQNEQPKSHTVCLGFVFLKPTHKLLVAWEELRKVHANKLLTGNITIRDTEQKMFNEIALQTKLTMHFLNRELFLSGKLLQRMRLNESTITPVQIHNNWIVGHAKKLDRMKTNGLWMVNLDKEQGFTCDYRDAKTLSRTPLAPKLLHKMNLTIKIMPSQPDQGNLPALISSILEADYNLEKTSREAQIDVELFVPKKNELLDTPLDFYTAAADRLKSEWKAGQVRIIQYNKNTSLELWLHAWKGDSDTEAAIFIDHSQVLSTQWINWVRVALGTIHVDDDKHEPRLFGIVLERSEKIISSAFSEAQDPEDKVEETYRPKIERWPFHFQNVGYHANLFLAHHWRRFKSWVVTWRKTNPGKVPTCSGFDYSALPAPMGEDLKSNFYLWWIGFTAIHGSIPDASACQATNAQSSYVLTVKSTAGLVGLHAPMNGNKAFSKMHSDPVMELAGDDILPSQLPSLANQRIFGTADKLCPFIACFPLMHCAQTLQEECG